MQQVALGGLLPLGGPRDGAWISEKAAVSVLRDAVRRERGLRLGRVRVRLADPSGRYEEPAVPAPPGALPPGELRIEGDFAIFTDWSASGPEALPAGARRLRSALAAAAEERLGLMVTEVDLRVTGLLDELPQDEDEERDEEKGDRAEDVGESRGETGEPSAETRPKDAATTTAGTMGTTGPPSDESRVAAAVLAVPGVAALAGLPGSLGRAVHLGTGRPTTGGTAVPRRHLRVGVSVHGDGRVLDVARAVRAAAGEALHDRPTVAVLVTRIVP